MRMTLYLSKGQKAKKSEKKKYFCRYKNRKNRKI